MCQIWKVFSGYVATHNGGISDRPLSCPSDAVVETSFICVIASVGVREKERVDVSSLKKLGKIYPVVEITLRSRFVFGILGELSTHGLTALRY